MRTVYMLRKGYAHAEQAGLLLQSCNLEKLLLIYIRN